MGEKRGKIGRERRGEKERSGAEKRRGLEGRELRVKDLREERGNKGEE